MEELLPIHVTVEKNDVNYQKTIELVEEFKTELQDNGFFVGKDTESKSGFLTSFVVKIVSPKAIENFVGVVGNWLIQDRTRTLKFQIGDKQIEATGLSQKEQQALIQWFQLQAGFHLDK